MTPDDRTEALRRIRTRLRTEVVDPPALARLLRETPGGTPAMAHRVLRRLEMPAALAPARPRTSPWVWAIPALAAAAAVLLFVPTREVPLRGAATSGLATAGLTLDVDGVGQLGGTSRSPVLTWEGGRVGLDVDPAARLHVTVNTPDAEVTVLGTQFEVTRDALGTRTEVTRGHVMVLCADGTQADLLVPEDAGAAAGPAEHLCLPATAAGLLGRARALEKQGTPDDVLVAVGRGLALGPSGAVERELRLVEVGTLLAQGKQPEALSAAKAALATPEELRRGELVDLVVTLSVALEGCAAASPWLPAVDSPATAAARARCSSP